MPGARATVSGENVTIARRPPRRPKKKHNKMKKNMKKIERGTEL